MKGLGEFLEVLIITVVWRLCRILGVQDARNPAVRLTPVRLAHVLSVLFLAAKAYRAEIAVRMLAEVGCSCLEFTPSLCKVLQDVIIFHGGV